MVAPSVPAGGNGAISRMIQVIRQRQGFSQEELARRLGVSFPTVNAWERGKSTPYPRHQKAIEDLYRSVVGSDGAHLALIVEDDESSGLVLADYVGMALPAWQTVVVNDGYDAILQIGLLKPALVLLDIMMPGIDGLQVYERLQASAALQHTRVVFVTAATDDAVLARARAAGAFALLQKPLRRAEVLEVLTRAGAAAGAVSASAP